MDEILENVQIITEKFNPEKIILFRFYVMGNQTPESDVDLLVITDGSKPNLKTSVDISLSVKHTYPIDIIVRSPQDIEHRLEKGDFFIRNIIEKGKVHYERTC